MNGGSCYFKRFQLLFKKPEDGFAYPIERAVVFECCEMNQRPEVFIGGYAVADDLLGFGSSGPDSAAELLQRLLHFSGECSKVFVHITGKRCTWSFFHGFLEQVKMRGDHPALSIHWLITFTSKSFFAFTSFISLSCTIALSSASHFSKPVGSSNLKSVLSFTLAPL